MRFILICASGRSGSTTLQRIINTIPNANICGECDGAILHLLHFYRSIKKTKRFTPKDNGGRFKTYESCIKTNTKPCWYNSFNYDQIIGNIKNMIINMMLSSEQRNKPRNNVILGFKEIRYFERNEDITLLKDFRELFPNTIVLLNYRSDVSKQSKSSWFSKNPTESKRRLQAMNNRMKLFNTHNGKYTYIVTFEDLFNVEKIKNMFKYINCQFNVLEYNKIMKNKME